LDGRLIAELTRIVGEAWIYTAEHQLRTYESDGLLQYHASPAAAVLPNSTEQVRAVVGACSAAGVPWVARGAGSGLSGGALPVKDGVLVVLSRMKRILEIDLDNGRVCVEPGVTNANVSAAVGPAFFYPPDPSSQIVCSIGGNVAENSGGAHCFKYGFTTNYVTGLELVLGDGSMVEIGGYELDTPGYDLLGAFVGSEGTLGVATKAWLRVVPVPETVKTLVAFFDSTHAAGEAVGEIVTSGVVPGAIEMMDKLAIEASEQMAHAGYPVGRGAALLVELDGAEDVGGGEPVLEAVRAAGVLGDVAADGADLLAARVRRVVVTLGRRGPGDVEVDDAGLDDRPLVLPADLPDGPHPRQHDQHAVLARQRTARQPGARTPRDERDAVVVAGPDDRGHLLGGLREHDQRGGDLVVGQPVALVGAQPEVVVDDRLGRQRRPGRRGDRGHGGRVGPGGTGRRRLLRWRPARGRAGRRLRAVRDAHGIRS
jgi:hypothetical protein